MEKRLEKKERARRTSALLPLEGRGLPRYSQSEPNTPLAAQRPCMDQQATERGCKAGIHHLPPAGRARALAAQRAPRGTPRPASEPLTCYRRGSGSAGPGQHLLPPRPRPPRRARRPRRRTARASPPPNPCPAAAPRAPLPAAGTDGAARAPWRSLRVRPGWGDGRRHLGGRRGSGTAAQEDEG